MEVHVLLFGPEARAAGCSRVSVHVEAPCTCDTLKHELARTVPAIASLIPAARIALNAEFAPPGCTIAPGDEVALIGMVSGG